MLFCSHGDLSKMIPSTCSDVYWEELYIYIYIKLYGGSLQEDETRGLSQVQVQPELHSKIQSNGIQNESNRESLQGDYESLNYMRKDASTAK